MVTEVLRNDKDGRIRSILREAVQVEDANAASSNWLGWQWFDVRAYPATLMKLVINGVIRVNFKSNSATCYLLTDSAATKSALGL